MIMTFEETVVILPDGEELNRAEVMQCNDMALLNRWKNMLDMQDIELSEMVSAMGRGNAHNVSRKLGFTRIGIKWIQLRAAELTGDGGLGLDDLRRSRLEQHIQSMTDGFAKLKAKYANLRTAHASALARIAELEAKLKQREKVK